MSKICTRRIEEQTNLQFSGRSCSGTYTRSQSITNSFWCNCCTSARLRNHNLHSNLIPSKESADDHDDGAEHHTVHPPRSWHGALRHILELSIHQKVFWERNLP